MNKKAMRPDTDNLKVIVCIPTLAHGGAEVLVKNILCGWTSDRVSIMLCVLSCRLNTGLEKELDLKGVNVKYLGMKYKFSIGAIVRLAKLLRGYRPDVIHTHLNALVFALIPAVLLGIRHRIHTIHNIAEKEGKALYRFIAAIAMRLFGFRPIGISSTIATSISRFYGVNEVVIINNAISTDEYVGNSGLKSNKRKELGIPEDAFVCINVARFYIQKNQAFLANVFAEAIHKYELSNAMLLLVGDGPLRGSVDDEIKASDMTGRIKMLGIRDDVRELLAASDIFIFPSLWEGLPMSIIEAQAAGLPVIASPVGGIPDMVIDGVTGYLVDTGQPDVYANRINDYYRNNGLIGEHSQAAIKNARASFDIRISVMQHERFYMGIYEAV